MTENVIRKILLILIVLLIVFAAINFFLSDSGACIVGNPNSCSNIQNSKYGEILGVKVSLIGLIAFIFLLIFYVGAFKNWKYKENFYEIYLLLVLVGCLGSIYFISLQLFVLKTICINCMIIDCTIILVGILTLIDYAKQKRR